MSAKQVKRLRRDTKAYLISTGVPEHLVGKYLTPSIWRKIKKNYKPQSN